MTPDEATALRRPFPPESVGQLPKGGALLDYVGHAAVTDRLLAVDPGWSWEPMAVDPYGNPQPDAAGNLWIRLTICGVTRIGVGDGKSMKERVGDAIRNAAMRFGVALDLWAKENLVEFRMAVATHARQAADEAQRPAVEKTAALQRPPAGGDAPQQGNEAPRVERPPAGAQTTGAEPLPAPAAGTSVGDGEGEAPEPTEEPAAPRGPRMSTRAQHRMIHGLLGGLNGPEKMPDQDRYDIASAISHQRISSFNELTHASASAVIEALQKTKTRADLDQLLGDLSRAQAARWNAGDRS